MYLLYSWAFLRGPEKLGPNYKNFKENMFEVYLKFLCLNYKKIAIIIRQGWGLYENFKNNI